MSTRLVTVWSAVSRQAYGTHLLCEHCVHPRVERRLFGRVFGRVSAGHHNKAFGGLAIVDTASAGVVLFGSGLLLTAAEDVAQHAVQHSLVSGQARDQWISR